jgi:hypothetical protein
MESLRNRTPSNLKLHHISKNPSFFWQEDGPPGKRDPVLKHTQEQMINPALPGLLHIFYQCFVVATQKHLNFIVFYAISLLSL